MKYLKMLGLAAVAAMALMAFFGASSASAGVLCKTDTDPCAEGQDLVIGDELTASLTAGTQAHLSAAFSSVTCATSHFKAKVENTGGSGKNVVAELSELTFTDCECGGRTMHVTATFPLGTLEINDKTEVVGKNSQFTTNCTGLAKCEFGTVAAGTKLATVTESNTAEPPSTAELHVNATLTWFAHEGGSSQFICAGFGDTAKFEAKYQITSPDPLYHSAS